VTEPTTVNVGIVIPNTGDLVGTWGSAAVNPDFVALDGYLGGVQTLTLSNAPVVLTVPVGFTATPSPGPTQAQNAVLRLTGALTSGVNITLPLPGYYIVENLTTGNFVVTLQAVTATQVIGIDQGMCQHVYNDGANVRFVNLGETGKMEFWTGYTAMPAWVTACTKPPYLLCDGTATYTFAVYPYLGNRYGSNFGGNGVTTFGTPDMRGRVPLAYDGTGTRITSAVCGINGQTIGASADNQGVTLTAAEVPTITVTGVITVQSQNGQTGIPTTTSSANVRGSLVSSTGGSVSVPSSTSASWGAVDALSASNTLNSNNTGGQSHPNVQPSQVAGIWVVRAA
jgi:microcystin-dependent protein